MYYTLLLCFTLTLIEYRQHSVHADYIAWYSTTVVVDASRHFAELDSQWQFACTSAFSPILKPPRRWAIQTSVDQGLFLFPVDVAGHCSPE